MRREADRRRAGGYRIPADADSALTHAFADLLHKARAAGTVRPDITPDDVQALVIGCVAVARHRGDTGLVRIVIDGLRP